MTRVYVPATLAMLQGLVADGEVDAVGRTAFAVTPALREAYTAGDDEELAEVAMAEAARASLRLLGSEEPNDRPSFASRRVVIAADVDEVKPRPDLDDAVVKLAGPITMRAVASVHIDLQEAEADVARAREIVDAAELGDEEAEFVLGDAEDHELAWYAAQELPFLLELL
ncbi:MULTISPECIES: DUF6912 family protein [Rhodococcus]|nr:hypothetical protein [Rhodococcus pyridinivorans]MCD2118172.1 hypothetical protein [Rhodococcus pyridinivorans]MCZ4627003.1 hypothetical protein [Rhodococcus pyridinivorans]MCZ4648254.1 hypothetical protein [Rhodococcus pyridinivorans]MDJ0480961.1 hypothetical protein [Rhodococcus pyridinivorans]MDV7254375.1 hypothetical protein [Rhodococcus pyridinivorans]